ncbi:ASCH domain-containing protein [Jidongwangia harbinensis]|uniref:ASCH domain-containing protein n=1 Tax=Jidongwangia harbinensis TaxID=2878561 RepID=UPI001CD9BB58|nr:ASCH domain-containing protein [Jidongwangia harbinensis]MCA2216561.1 dCMP deaminase [Jidongwangia harbinensis]
MIEAARSLVGRHGDGNIHTVAAAVLDEHGRTHVGLNLYHFTGGPCAELVALAAARAAGARAPRLLVAVGDAGRGVLAPCGRDRQVLADYFPDIQVIVPTGADVRVVPIGDLLPHTYRWPAQQVQRLRFRAGHLPAVRDGSKRVTMRYADPVQVGPALLVFEFDEEISLPGRITSTMAKRLDRVTDDEAREDGFAGAADVLPGLRDYYPGLQPGDEIVIVRFDVDDG